VTLQSFNKPRSGDRTNRQEYQAAKENIMDNTPRGGAKDLALEQTDIFKSRAIGSTQANAFLRRFRLGKFRWARCRAVDQRSHASAVSFQWSEFVESSSRTDAGCGEGPKSWIHIRIAGDAAKVGAAFA